MTTITKMHGTMNIKEKISTAWKPALIPSSGKEALNLVDPLYLGILSHRAP